MYEDVLIEVAVICRLAEQAVCDKIKAQQLGEAFKGLETEPCYPQLDSVDIKLLY